MLALLLTSLLTLAPPNLLPGDTSFDLGAGPVEVTASPQLAEQPRLVDGALALPTPGASGREGCTAVVPASEPLPADQPLTLAWQAQGTAGALFSVTVTDAFGRRESARYRVDGTWRTQQLTFSLRPPPRSPGEAAAVGVDWAARRLIAGETAPPPRVSVTWSTLGHAGAPGLVYLDDLRLVPGATAREAAPADLAIDATWDGRSWGPLWQPRQQSIEVAARGPEAAARVVIRDSLGVVVSERDLPAGASCWTVPLELPPGYYLAELTVTAALQSRTTVRPLCLLRDRTTEPLDSPWLLDAAGLAWGAEARALGYRQVRLVATWASLADREGQLDEAALDRLLTPALAAGLEVILALAVSGPAALPAGVVTPRRMDSHGYLKAVPLPDVDRFGDWVEAVARRCAGQQVVYEFDHEPFRSWHANDYVEYLRRFATALRAGDPGARLAGFGFALEAAGVPKLAAFAEESLKRGGPALVDRVTLHLPERQGDAPEAMLGLGLGALLAPWLAHGQKPAIQIAPRAVRPVGPPLAGAPRLTPAARLAEEVSPWQLGARALRAYLLALRAAPIAFATGWQGDHGPREAYLDHWLARYHGARLVAERPLGEGLQALLLELPSGLGLAAVWDSADQRWSPTEPREDGPPPVLELTARPGILRARGPDGRELRETYGDERLAIPLSMAPVYLEGPSPAWVDERLLTASVAGQEAVVVAAGLGLADGQPGLLLSLANRGAAAVAGEVSLQGSAALELLAARLSYQVAPGEVFRRLVPVVHWTADAPAPIRVLAEAGREIVPLRRVMLQWPAVAAPLPVADANDVDWPEAVATYRLASADQLIDPLADWLGPDDAAAEVRLRYHQGALALYAEVHDDRLAAPADGFAGDGLELLLDLDLQDTLLAPPNGDDYRVILAPLIEGQFQGRHKLLRGAGPGSAMLADKAVRSSFRRTTSGYRVELLLPLTAEGQAAVEAGGLGLDLLLNDDDGRGREVRLVLFGGADSDRSTAAYAHVWPARRPLTAPVERTMPSSAPPPPLLRVGFEPGEAAAWRLLLAAPPGVQAWQGPVTDFPRGTSGLVVTRAAPGEGALAEVAVPRGATDLAVWARAESSGESAPRLGVELAGRTRWFESGSTWRRWDVPLDPGTAQLRLHAAGVGRLEIAELNFVARAGP